ncbi:GMC family oxidoreductase [Hwanghaeella sp. 1Z406]|jgi:choline dehydrogenase|uniref:GMC family oxidoreductase n=1 Tax=Hwanghaeella sp. 1Z406 TaxID=3402811 RepID=UPI003B6717BC|tara:strand:- start:94754 stop:96364 length:1611 start_codon:yes stop_codon:yes gene_type:complete
MEADYIIVGAGSAGCVLAEKLSAHPNNRVIVVEAGGADSSFWISTPIGYGRLFYDKAVNWCYTTEPDPSLDGRTSHWPRGRVLGGSSSINALVCIRGRAEDYEDWAAATGDTRWGPDAMAACFRTLDDNDQGANEWRNSGGVFPIHSIKEASHPITQNFLDACAETGVPRNPDFNGERQEGAGLYQINTQGGKRVSAADAFLRPAMRRPNLTVLKRTQALRLIFSENRCTGIVVQRNGEQVNLVARKEVLLASGAIESPKLLQLSGIGDAGHLSKLGINVRVDNPNVGANLQDHVGLNYYFRSKVPTLNQELSPIIRRFWNGARYLLTRSGPLSLSVNQGGAFFKTSPDRPLPNMQLYLQLITTLNGRGQARPLLAPDPFPAFALGLSNIRPKSRGSIQINSADPLAPPMIDARAYSASEDLDEMLEAVEFIRKLVATKAFSGITESEIVPGPDVQSRSDLLQDIRQRTGTVYHPSCTCAMGLDPKASVLDSELRVRGLDGLRVVDASSFPNIVSGNLNVPVMMLAVQASEIISKG